MKEFDKWFSDLDDIQNTRLTKQNRIIANLTWKAALELVLDMVYGGDIYNNAYHISAQDIDIIKKELEDD